MACLAEKDLRKAIKQVEQLEKIFESSRKSRKRSNFTLVGLGQDYPLDENHRYYIEDLANAVYGTCKDPNGTFKSNLTNLYALFFCIAEALGNVSGAVHAVKLET